jgi:hypothetical protein
VPVSSIDAAHDYFYSDVLTSLPNRQSSPQGALSDALSSSHLTIEKIGTALVISDDVPDPRNELIVKIRNALTAIVAGERAEAAMHTRLLDEENALTKGIIYTGAFMHGIGSSAWGMLVWIKEVSDVVNPFVKMQHHAKALQTAWESEDFSKTYADTYVKGEKRELVEALGFDPTAITEQQIDEAMAMTSLVMDDPNISGMLYQFTKDYAEAQHAIEVTNVIGSAVFEIILAIVMAAVTGGVGVVAAVGSKAHLIKKFQKVGDLLQDFAKATSSLKLQAKKRKTKGNQNAALPVEKVEAKKTDAHRAEDGKVSNKPSKKVEPKNLTDAKNILAARREEIAANGYQPKYSDAELKAIAQTGDVGSDRYQVRFMETNYLNHRDTPDVPLSGSMGRSMAGKSGTGAKYWSTSFDQLEDADTDPKLISEKLGLTYNSNTNYSLVIVDSQAAAPLTGVKSVSATFKNVSEFSNTELPDKFPKEFTDKAMTPEFQAEYSSQYKAAQDAGAFDKKWSADEFENHLNTTDLSGSDKALMKQRFEMHETIGNNDDYLGNGLTKNNNPAVNQEYGVVETLNFERNEVNLSQLDQNNAITTLPGLSPI